TITPNNREKLNMLKRCSRFKITTPERTIDIKRPLLKASENSFLKARRIKVPSPQHATKKDPINRDFINILA
ncbi:MAG: hypothetical protein ABH880_02545, partial [Patescibacteria group bacterium]